MVPVPPLRARPEPRELPDALEPDLVWRFLEDGARVLQALHGHGLIHYDVTPGNFILEEAEAGPRFVLTDGGLAHLGPVEGSSRGTPLYLAPELLDEQPPRRTGRPLLSRPGRIPARDRTRAVRRRRGPRPPPPQAPVRTAGPFDQPTRPHAAGRGHRRAALPTAGSSPRNRRRAAAPHRGSHGSRHPRAARGGGLRGRRRGLHRRTDGCDGSLLRVRLQISSALAILRARTNGFTVSGIDEPVLLLSGDAGSGTTRLAREMVHKAQAAEIPVLLIAGRDGAPNPQAPLDLLFEALATLGSDRGPSMDTGVVPRAEATTDANAPTPSSARWSSSFASPTPPRAAPPSCSPSRTSRSSPSSRRAPSTPSLATSCPAPSTARIGRHRRSCSWWTSDPAISIRSSSPTAKTPDRPVVTRCRRCRGTRSTTSASQRLPGPVDGRKAT